MNHLFLSAVVGVILIASGCGGGGHGSGGSGGSSGSSAAPSETAVQKTGNVLVTVVDPLGSPAIGQMVDLYHNASGLIASSETDQSGSVRFDGTPSGNIRVYASQQHFAAEYADSSNQRLPDDGTIEVALRLRPEPQGMGILSAAVDSVGADGRSLEISLQLLYQPGGLLARPNDGGDHPPFPYSMLIDPLGITSSGNFTAAYELSQPGYTDAQVLDSAPTVVARSVIVLMDHSAALTFNFPDTPGWLYALKSTLLKKRESDQVLLAAYAVDDSDSGERSRLPVSPVTFLPVDDPVFTDSAKALFPAVDSLFYFQGGKSPLYAALDVAVDYLNAHALPATDKLVVVLANTADDTCGSTQECRIAREAVIAHSLASGTRIIAINTADPGTPAEQQALSQLALGSGGSVLWTDVFDRQGVSRTAMLGAMLAGDRELLEAHFVLESAVAGAFTSGRMVEGTVHLRDCSYGCYYDYRPLPFTVRVP